MNDSCLDDDGVWPLNDCHARVSVNKIWLICYMFLGLSMALVEVRKMLPRGIGGRVPGICASSLMWHIYDCLYRDRWALASLWDPGIKRICASVVTTSDARLQPIGSWGGCWPTACAPPSKGFVWACCAAGLTTVYYLYHLRGLTGFGLVLFHPNIIILWLSHNWIGVGELMMLFTYANGYVWILVCDCLYCNWLWLVITCKCLFLVHP